MTQTLAILAGALGLGVLLLLIYHKLSSAIDRLGKQLPHLTGNVFAQVEALLALQTELRLQHPLPPTRGWAASPDFLRNVMTHALATRPNCIVECSSGVSTIVLARCAQLSGRGHVYSLEHDGEFANKTRLALAAEGLSDWATVLDAPLCALDLPGWSGQWYRHDVLPTGLQADMLVIDGPPWFVGPLPRYPAVPVLYPCLIDQAAVFLDDAARPAETEAVRRWLEQYPSLKTFEVPACEKGCVALRLSQARDSVNRP